MTSGMADRVDSPLREGKEMVVQDGDLSLTDVSSEVRRQRATIQHLQDQQDIFVKRLAELEARHKNKKGEFADVWDIAFSYTCI